MATKCQVANLQQQMQEIQRQNACTGANGAGLEAMPGAPGAPGARAGVDSAPPFAFPTADPTLLKLQDPQAGHLAQVWQMGKL